MEWNSVRERVRDVIMLIIVSVASLIALATIAAAIAHPYISTLETPSILENWGGLIIGFYFGSFLGLLKEWMVPNLSWKEGSHERESSQEQKASSHGSSA